MPCVGGYLDGTVDKKVGDGNRLIIDGRNAEYGYKRIALVQTSDSRSSTYADLGKHSTWVKWAVPSAEALRQACLAQESRISQRQPALPTISISRISVDNSQFLGPIELELNAQFNAVIGGRGTGKSTLLDYLRWALCDLPAKIDPEDEISDPISRQRRLIASTLVPTQSTVAIHFIKNQLPHIVRRNAANGDLSLKVGDGEFSKANEQEIRELLPIQAYSQKQLSSVSVRIDELMRFITSPVRRQLASIDQRIADAESRTRETYAVLQRYRQLSASIHRLEFAERSLSEQAEHLRNSLEDVSDADRSVLDNKPKYDSAKMAADGWHEAATRTLRSADEFLSSLPGVDSTVDETPTELEESLTALKNNTEQVVSAFRESVTSALESLRSGLGPTAEHEVLYQNLKQTFYDFEAQYSTVRARSSVHQAKLAELAGIDNQHQAAGETLRIQRAELNDLGQPFVRHRELVHQMFDLVASRSDVLAEQCSSLSDLSGGLLRATLRRGHGLNNLAEQFRAAISGSGIRSTRTDGVFDELKTEENPVATWETALLELEVLTTLESDEDPTTERFPTLARLGIPPSELKKIASRLTPDRWLALAMVPVGDRPKFEYRTKEDQYINFETASAGQQATALLQVLLAQTGPPLIIDQPEDDLDSEIIQEIVQQIWDAKQRRQLIFSSHNANLVVNGDAELVIHCDYRVAGEQSRGELKDQGAIDHPTIRSAIVRVMDGGEKAFRLRAEKYGF
jgi:type III restriction enzyme